MATSKTTICNLALSHTKQTETRIANLDTDTGPVADLCRLHYDPARSFLLSNYRWNFALKSVALAEVSENDTRYLYAYDYPSDCIRAHEIERDTSTEEPIVFIVRNGVLYTNKQNARLVYVYDQENVASFSPAFVKALAWYLGSELTPALNGDDKTQEACLTMYRNIMATAASNDSSEGVSDPELLSSWDRARLYPSDDEYYSYSS